MSYRVRFTLPDGRTGHFMHDYATREEAQQAIDDMLQVNGLTYTVEEAAKPTDGVPYTAPDDRIRELEDTLALMKSALRMVNDAFDAARQDRDVAERRLAIVESLGDAMHRAMTTAQKYIGGQWGGVNMAMKEWAAYKDSLAASRQGPAKASEAPGEGQDSGEGAK